VHPLVTGNCLNGSVYLPLPVRLLMKPRPDDICQRVCAHGCFALFQVVLLQQTMNGAVLKYRSVVATFMLFIHRSSALFIM
jgi:hypothetical protein